MQFTPMKRAEALRQLSSTIYFNDAYKRRPFNDDGVETKNCDRIVWESAIFHVGAAITHASGQVLEWFVTAERAPAAWWLTTTAMRCFRCLPKVTLFIGNENVALDS